MVKGKTIVLGVTGGIAAYKAAAVCSGLTQRGAQVHVIMTESAVKFIAPLTFQAISRQRVIVDTFNEEDASVIAHIDLADRADAVVVAPLTANFLAKMALGLGDDMLSTTLLAVRAPVIVAPAMNVHMYANPVVQQHMAVLRSRGVEFVEAGEGFLACGYTGKGRLAEPDTIIEAVERKIGRKSSLAGARVLVTAGGTVERIDPVRYITNDSSGKMGFAIAAAAQAMGADVTVVAAHTSAEPPAGVRIVRVESADDMFREVTARYDGMDIVVKAAAVADYRPVQAEERKIKKSDERMTLELIRTPDILKELGARKKRQVLIGFAAETHDLDTHALAKLRSKNCDMLVANDVTAAGAGFRTDTNAVSVFSCDGSVDRIPLQSKREVGERILAAAERLWKQRKREQESDGAR